MLLGVPCVASYVGGTCDMLEHNKEGFLYTYTEPAILAEYIKRMFEDDELCMKFSNNAINKANITQYGTQKTAIVVQRQSQMAIRVTQR